MTVIAAVARDGHVVMAADRQTNYQGQATFGARKIRRLTVPDTTSHRTVLLAGTGNGALLPAVDRGLVLADVPTPFAGLEALTDWAETVAIAVTEIAAASIPPLLEEQDGTQVLDGALLLGYGGHLWYLFTGQVSHAVDDVAALGCGSELALGAMHTSLGGGDTPTTAVLGAVDLACRFIAYCGTGPDQGTQLEET